VKPTLNEFIVRALTLGLKKLREIERR